MQKLTTYEAEITSVEKVSSTFVDWDAVRVTATNYDVSVTYKVPAHRAASYTIGRKVIVSVGLVKK